jgi:hypothetical protein
VSRAHRIVSYILGEAIIDVSQERDKIMSVLRSLATQSTSLEDFVAKANGDETLKNLKVWITTKPEIKHPRYSRANEYTIFPARQTIKDTLDDIDFGLSHELVHKHQHKRAGRYQLRGGFEADSAEGVGTDRANYLAAPFEMMAYAETHVRSFLQSGWPAYAILDRLKNPSKYKLTNLEKAYLALPPAAKNRFFRYVYDYAQRLNK